jgi:peptidoglycan/LPS O-acetylase OafA/YrhL
VAFTDLPAAGALTAADGTRPPAFAVTAPDAASTLLATAPVLEPPGRYLREFDLFRVITFACVVAQHAILWSVDPHSVAGWGLVVVLHFTRNAFFFLSAFVALYAQATRPRRVGSLWGRRLSQIAVPFLAWTGLYFAYTIASGPTPDAWVVLRTDLTNGYYQLYFLVVLAQFYVLLPALLWLIRVTRRHHWTVLSVSIVFQVAMGTVSHYAKAPGWQHSLHVFDANLLQSRLIVGYQLYFVAGLLAAAHADQLHAFVDRHRRRILWGALAIGLGTEGYYLITEAVTHNTGRASDLYQPEVLLWFGAAILGLLALGRVWSRREAVRGPTRASQLLQWAADASGGYYLAHVLILQLILDALGGLGWRYSMSWVDTAWILFFGTLAGTTLLLWVLLQTPLRVILTGPDRAAQRRALRPDYGGFAPASTSDE